MKPAFLFSFVLCALCLVITVSVVKPRSEPLVEDLPIRLENVTAAPPDVEFTPSVNQDELITIRVQTDEGVVAMSLREYLPYVVAAEMPIYFEEEALKAQAVTARTYTLYRCGRGGAHPEADVCTNPSHCSAMLSKEQLLEKWGEDYEKNFALVVNAVDETDNMVVKYEGELIDAVFHSTSSGKTESSVDVWGAEREYLVSVESPGEEEAPRYSGTVEFSPNEIKTLLNSQIDGLDFSGEAKTWFSAPVRSEAGSVLNITVCGVSVKGSVIRTALGLNSSNFTVTYDGEKFTFTTLGYGHGVGMSQYGANAMASNGSSYTEILCHYYCGAAVEKYNLEGEEI